MSKQPESVISPIVSPKAVEKVAEKILERNEKVEKPAEKLEKISPIERLAKPATQEKVGKCIPFSPPKERSFEPILKGRNQLSTKSAALLATVPPSQQNPSPTPVTSGGSGLTPATPRKQVEQPKIVLTPTPIAKKDSDDEVPLNFTWITSKGFLKFQDEFRHLCEERGVALKKLEMWYYYGEQNLLRFELSIENVNIDRQRCYAIRYFHLSGDVATFAGFGADIMKLLF